MAVQFWTIVAVFSGCVFVASALPVIISSKTGSYGVGSMANLTCVIDPVTYDQKWIVDSTTVLMCGITSCVANAANSDRYIFHNDTLNGVFSFIIQPVELSDDKKTIICDDGANITAFTLSVDSATETTTLTANVSQPNTFTPWENTSFSSPIVNTPDGKTTISTIKPSNTGDTGDCKIECIVLFIICIVVLLIKVVLLVVHFSTDKVTYCRINAAGVIILLVDVVVLICSSITYSKGINEECIKEECVCLCLCLACIVISAVNILILILYKIYMTCKEPAPPKSIHVCEGQTTISNITVESFIDLERCCRQTFYLCYKDENTNTWSEIQSMNIIVDRITKKISDLKSSTTYKIKVFAEDKYGKSKATEVVGRTHGTPEPPKMFKACKDLTTDKSITIEFLPGFDGGYQQSFVLIYKSEEELKWKMEEIHNHENHLIRKTIEPLERQTKYTVKMVAVNQCGKSKETYSIEIRTKGLPNIF